MNMELTVNFEFEEIHMDYMLSAISDAVPALVNEAKKIPKSVWEFSESVETTYDYGKGRIKVKVLNDH